MKEEGRTGMSAIAAVDGRTPELLFSDADMGDSPAKDGPRGVVDPHPQTAAIILSTA